MPTFIISGTEHATIPRRTLHVAAKVTGPPSAVRLVVDGSEDAVHARHDRLVLARVTEHREIGIRPEPGDRPFPQRCEVSLAIRTESDGGEEAYEVLLTPVDVSGLRSRGLVTVAPAGTHLVVSALDAVAEQPLNRLQGEARDATRALLGRQVPRDRAEVAVIAVDPSASMLPAVADGSVEAFVDLVCGTSTVLSHGVPPRVCVLDSPPRWVPPTPLPDVAGALLPILRAHGATLGFSVDPHELISMGNGARTVVYVLTDAPPAGWPDRPSTASAGTALHLVTIAEPGAPLPMPGTALPPPPRDGNAAAHLLSTPGRVAGLVSSLLGDRFADPATPTTDPTGPLR